MKPSKLLFLALISLITACGDSRFDSRIAGPKGDPGTPGKDASCTVTNIPSGPVLANGGANIVCSDGTNVLIANGAKGNTGSTGATGATGSQGVAGTPGTLISSVQLCPGTPSYPSKFIEVAFCISDQLYAVYSANDGFMTLIPPGAYSSNGIGSSCSLTVLAHCKVQN